MSEFANYYNKVQEEAKNFVDENINEIYFDVEEDGLDDIYEFVNDHRLHEWVDSDFIRVDLIDSANIVEQSNNVEEDCGLWEGQSPTKAIETQAFFTYKNDMNEEIMPLIKDKLQVRLEEREVDLVLLKEKLELEYSEDTEEKIEILEQCVEFITSAIDNI